MPLAASSATMYRPTDHGASLIDAQYATRAPEHASTQHEVLALGETHQR
jgi:hypothetical protein